MIKISKLKSIVAFGTNATIVELEGHIMSANNHKTDKVVVYFVSWTSIQQVWWFILPKQFWANVEAIKRNFLDIISLDISLFWRSLY